MKREKYSSVLQEAGRSRRNRGTLWQTTATVFCLLFVVSGAVGQQKPSEYQVEAAYLFNFGRFVEWPAKLAPAKTGPFTICVLGQDPFGPALDKTVAGGMIGNQSVAARRISTPHDSGDCQILYISSSEESRLNKIIESLDKNPVLTVSDIPGFSQRRGMIEFVREGNRIRFEVNLTATQSAGLNLSSDLLKVATSVRRSRQSGD